MATQASASPYVPPELLSNPRIQEHNHHWGVELAVFPQHTTLQDDIRSRARITDRIIVIDILEHIRCSTLVYALTSASLSTCRSWPDTHMPAIRILQSKLIISKRPCTTTVILPFDSAAVAWSRLHKTQSGSTFLRAGTSLKESFKARECDRI